MALPIWYSYSALCPCNNMLCLHVPLHQAHMRTCLHSRTSWDLVPVAVGAVLRRPLAHAAEVRLLQLADRVHPADVRGGQGILQGRAVLRRRRAGARALWVVDVVCADDWRKRMAERPAVRLLDWAAVAQVYPPRSWCSAGHVRPANPRKLLHPCVVVYARRRRGSRLWGTLARRARVVGLSLAPLSQEVVRRAVGPDEAVTVAGALDLPVVLCSGTFP